MPPLEHPRAPIVAASPPPPTSAGASKRRVIEATHLRKLYGSTVAVDDVSFEVFEGEIFGLIGPNGAGKTTTMECVEGVRKADAGRTTVLGLDPARDASALQQRIGVQLQQAQLQKRIRVWEAVDLWASLYPRTVDGRALLEQLGLKEKRNASFMSLSGGQKQRLFIALALINDPEVVFLDELTTGLDPAARRTIWDLVNGIRSRGKTVFLTTHLMEEAERLCDRVAIIEHGRLIEMGAPADLIRRHCPERGVVFSCDHEGLAGELEHIAGAGSVCVEGTTYTVQGQGDDFVTAVIRFIAAHALTVRDFRTVFPTLEDVFLKLTGHVIRD
jgi:ABC-2 type transport system ATP-binding protein